MSAPITPEGKTCAYEGCDKPATHVAQGRSRAGFHEPGRHPDVAAYCETRADAVAGEGSPEYTVDCPNCSCQFGVN